MIVGQLKALTLRAIALPTVGRLLAARAAAAPSIVMMHRFASVGHEGGHDAARFRALLSYLRRVGVHLVSVEDLVDAAIARADSRATPGRDVPTVAFTVDDGYRDFLDVAVPILAEFDCPATAFVVPDVIDGKLWFWWDQLAWIQRHSARAAITIALRGGSASLACGNAPEAAASMERLQERLKALPNAERLEALQSLARAAEVSIPDVPPSEFAVMSWDDLRGAERRGLRFGAHTMTHPILSMCTDEQSRWEISASIARVREEVAQPSTVFCYPNGRAIDFGEREIASLKAAGSLAAVSTVSMRVDARVTSPSNGDWRWQLPRFAYDERRGAMERNILL